MSLYVPVGLDASGLSEIVNELVQRTDTYHFLVENEFLHGTLGDFLHEKEWSLEKTLHVSAVRRAPLHTEQDILPNMDWISSMAVVDDHTVLVGEFGGHLNIWHKAEGKYSMAGRVKLDRDTIRAIKHMTLSGENVVVAAHGCTVGVYRLETRSLDKICHHGYHTNTVECVAVDRDRELVVSGSWDHSICVARVENGKCVLIRTITGHSGPVSALRFDGHRLYSGSWDHSARVWDVDSGALLETTLVKHAVGSLDVFNEYLAVGCLDNRVRIYRDRQKILAFDHPSRVSGVCWDRSREEGCLYTICHDGCLRMWDVRSMRPVNVVDLAGNGENKLFSLCVERECVLVGGENAKTYILNK